MYMVGQALQTERIVPEFVMSVYAHFGVQPSTQLKCFKKCMIWRQPHQTCSRVISYVTADMLQSMLETIRLYMQAMQETVLNILLLQITEPFLQFEEFSNN